MSTPQDGKTSDSVGIPADANPPTPPQAQGDNVEVAVEITDIKASGLPAKVGFFSGLFYVRVKGGKVPQRTKTAKYTRADEFVAHWDDTVQLSGLESSKVEIEVYARRFPFSYKIIKKTESKESLADLLEHAETPVELELLEEGQAAGRLVFKISKSNSGVAEDATPPDAPTAATPAPVPENLEQAA